MRFLIVFFAIFLYASSVDKKIYVAKKYLNHNQTKMSNISVKLDKIIRQINKTKNTLVNINKNIQKVDSKISELSIQLSKNNNNLKNLENNKTSLLTIKANMQNKIIKFIANNYCVENKKIYTTQDLIDEQILKAVLIQASKKMGNVLQEYHNIDAKITQITNTINKIQNDKKQLLQKEQELKILKQKQKQAFVKLEKIKQNYKKTLQNIIKSQNLLRKQLETLKVIKKREIEKIRQAQMQKEAQNKNAKNINLKIKNYSNVYMKTRTIRYRGAKTIKPVSGKIIQQFGKHIDPVYKITIYNDAIVIKTKPNAFVKSIFDGVVMYSGTNPSDGKKMIVIKHPNHLYSVYARLSKISPFIKKGYKVKKGEVIAKTDGELKFEITYKTLPINPKEVVRF